MNCKIGRPSRLSAVLTCWLFAGAVCSCNSDTKPAVKTKADTPPSDNTGVSTAPDTEPSSPKFATVEIGASGGEVRITGAQLVVPAQALTGPTKIALSNDPSALDRANIDSATRQRLDEHFKVLRVYEGAPSGTRFSAPATLTVSLPKNLNPQDIHVVSISESGEVEDVSVLSRRAGSIEVEVKHFSTIVVAMAIVSIGLVGTMALTMKVLSEPMMRRDCAKWLDDKNATVRALAQDPSKFSIGTGKERPVHLDLGKPLRGENVDQGSHALGVQRIIERGYGDCVNMSFLFGSLLLAKGYPVRTVSGHAVYSRGTKTYSGFHQWVEVVVEGKPYYVDTFEPSQTKLIPIKTANRSLKLKRSLMCGKNPDGSIAGKQRYKSDWYNPYVSEVEEMKARLEELKREHKRLNNACTSSASNMKACNDRHKVYKQAIELRKEIQALEP